MKKWFLEVIKRIGDLVIKLISVKVFVACVITWYARLLPSEIGILTVAVAWLLVVGFRYAEKAMHLIKGA